MRTHAIAIAILTTHLVLFSLLNIFINPHPDMLDHWVWSQHLALSYYEHPPMVAWAIRLVTLIGGNSETALELGAQFYNLSILALCYAICFRLFGKHAAIFCLILLESTPYFLLGSVFLHIDQPFLIFWLFNLYFICRFHQSPSPRWLILLGISAGLGALSKYITLLFYFGVFLHFSLYKKQRHHLKNPWLYAAGFLSLAIFSPVLIWNFQNDWVSFRFQFTRGLSGAPLGQNFILFTLGHLAIFSIVWSGWGFYQIWKKRGEIIADVQPDSIIFIISVFPLLFFSVMSFRGSIADPHWANVTYLGMMMLSGKTLARIWPSSRNRIHKKMLVGGVLLNLIILLLVFLHIQYPFIGFPQYQLKYYSPFARHDFDPQTVDKLRVLKNQPPLEKKAFLARLQQILSPEEFELYQEKILKIAAEPHHDLVTTVLSWEETAEDLIILLKKSGKYPVDAIISKEFQLSSALSFYLPDHPAPYSLEKPERNQWSPVEVLRDKRAVILCRIQVCGRVLRWTESRFQRKINYLGEISTHRGKRLIRRLEVYGFN
ncbi:MAG: glycosyltransferase family 39 protein [SAR324 cluster bacterium]|nr:glycosyltransferase family 39 protein [SAR324 cluster bacterium]